jgi:benzoyl-CoA reductase/2-hydroxyglutaryl-CoA dehydratase subunit BcrC/BadD/HgdB
LFWAESTALFYLESKVSVLKKIGLTTTAPIEVLIAAGYQPVDINNLFIGSDQYHEYIEFAERVGFPKNSCAWIKGIYGACIANNIKEIVGIVAGDCSNTNALLTVLDYHGVKIHTFGYPYSHELADVQLAIDSFIKKFETTIEATEEVRQSLLPVRRLAKELDRMTYEDNLISGGENHLLQLCMSDFDGDVAKYEQSLLELKSVAEKRTPFTEKLRLGFIGVPPMMVDLYDYVEQFSARFVFNEVQREFAFPRIERAKTIYEQYYDYTYPYSLNFRLQEISKQIELRKLDGIIHYTQASCYRAIDDIIIKEKLNIPILTIEGDKLNRLDARTKLRIEAFLDMLFDLKGAN